MVANIGKSGNSFFFVKWSWLQQWHQNVSFYTNEQRILRSIFSFFKKSIFYCFNVFKCFFNLKNTVFKVICNAVITGAITNGASSQIEFTTKVLLIFPFSMVQTEILQTKIFMSYEFLDISNIFNFLVGSFEKVRQPHLCYFLFPIATN